MLLFYLIYFCVMSGMFSYIGISPSKVFLYGLICLMQLYVSLLFQRRYRPLPPGLDRCKFVRLGYLRKMVAKGLPIRRCQALPTEAFGDVRTSSYLIIISHRWLHRFTCDVLTNDHPKGLRLETMVSALEDHFSAKGLPKPFAQGYFSQLRAALTGGYDVLVFFDFMCIPQVGWDSTTNELIPRTPEEEVVFKECLPNMGALYSQFPVIILDDVPDGAVSYFDSGWCFSELSTAQASRQLDRFSPKWSGGSKKHEDLVVELSEKLFAHASDKAVVETILKVYSAKGILVSAVEESNVDAVNAILSTTSDDVKSVILNQSVDDMFNSILHRAVAKKNTEIVEMLLEHGADPRLRNERGDAPHQWLMWPRRGRAARLVREHAVTGRRRSSSVPDVRNSADAAEDAEEIGASYV